MPYIEPTASEREAREQRLREIAEAAAAATARVAPREQVLAHTWANGGKSVEERPS